tara:strand:- start:931 stop:1290 length:360 start_codon:yes stop_codon:yes gene_type:complete
MDYRAKTIFCDIDGTLVKHEPPIVNAVPNKKLEILPETLKKISEWDSKGYMIILVTGRKESLRKNTIKQLAKVGIIYDLLIMGIGGGPRILINDDKPNGTKTAFAFNLTRNKGISDIEI